MGAVYRGRYTKTGQVVAVVSTDWGHSFAAPVRLGSESSVVVLPGDVMPNSGPTVAVSAQGDLRASVDADAYLDKPLEFDSLVATIDRMLPERQIARAESEHS